MELLSLLPENDVTLVAAYLQDNGYLEEKKDEYAQVSDEYTIIRTQPLFGTSPSAYSDEEWQQTLGFTLKDVDRRIFTGVPPMDYYQAVGGRFSPDEVESAVRTGPGNDILEEVSYQEHKFYRWGTDTDINMSMRSGLRPGGRGHRLALVDDFIFWVRWTDGIKEMIASYEGSIRSLADNEDYKLLAGGLGELDVVTALFSSGTQSYSYVSETYQAIIDDPGNNERQQTFVEEIQREPKLKPYQAFATGAGLDEDGYYLAIVLLNPDEETAEQNKTLLRQRINNSPYWSDQVRNMEIKSRGRLTIAKLYGSAAKAWNSFTVMGMMGPYEPLLVHE